MDFTLSTQQLAWQSRAKAFATDWISMHVAQLEEDPDARAQLFKKMADAGLFSLAVTLEGDTLAYLLAVKEIAKVDAGIALVMAVTNLVADIINTFGSDEQKARYLSGISNGLYTPAAFAITEPLAGSDLKNIKMIATPSNEAGVYLLNGQKQLITSGDIAAVTLFVAKSGQLRFFVVEGHPPGFRVKHYHKTLGLHTSTLVDLELVDCPAILLGADKQEQPIDLSALDMGRLQVAAQALGIAEAAFGVACHYARTRKQFGSLIAQQQMIAFKLADMQVAINAAEMLIYKAAWRRDLGLSYHHASAEAKLFCSEAASIIADQALQIFGGYGYTKEFPVEKYFRDARVTRIYEGTSEIQRLFIGSQLIISETVDCQDKKDSE